MSKFFVTEAAIQENTIILENDNFNHIKNVLRLGVLDELIINDRQGNDYKCIIKNVETHQIVANIQEKCQSNAEPMTHTVLFQSLIKGEKMELVIQKAIEIGVTEIVPMCTTRCVVKLEDTKKTTSKVERWQKIAEAAAKQSGRAIIPKVQVPMHFKEAIDYAKLHLDKCLIPYEKEKEMGLRSFLSTAHASRFGIFIGPEGGFTEEEVMYAKENQVTSLTLGKRILRSETAGLVALSAIMYEMGEMA